MSKKLTKLINGQFNPTLYNYGLGGRVYYDIGGMMMPNGMLDMSKYASQSPALSTGLTQGVSAVGEGMEQITNAYRPNKANYGTNIGGGALKGAAMGAALGSIVPGVGTVVGGVVGGVGGALSGLTKSIVKSGQIKQEEEQAQQQRRDMMKQQTIANLPGQPQYVATFARGGKIDHNKPRVARVSALTLGLPNFFAAGGEITDRVSSFDTGGLHSENGGIPIGRSAMVEKDEFMYTNKQGKKYIFSNKF